MAEFVGDGPGERQPRVLVDVAGAVGLTHARHLRQAQRAARLVHPVADVASGNQSPGVKEGQKD